MRAVFVLIFAAASVLSTATVAQQEEGDIEIGAFVMGIVIPNGDETIWNVTGTFSGGYYFTDNILAGVAPIVMITDAGGSTSSSYGGSAFGEYSFLYLLESTVLVPYAGAQYYLYVMSSGDETEAFHYIGGTLGLKYYVSEKTALDMSANYQFPLNGGGNGLIMMGVGFSILIGE
jgi:hypothetical protein